jgi:predicted ATPase
MHQLRFGLIDAAIALFVENPSKRGVIGDPSLTTVQSRNLQVILESHTEHLLQRLLRRIAERGDSPYPPITPNDVKLFFCQASEGGSRPDELKVNLFGSIENWPDDFFGDQFGEIAAREQAALKHRKAT